MSVYKKRRTPCLHRLPQEPCYPAPVEPRLPPPPFPRSLHTLANVTLRSDCTATPFKVYLLSLSIFFLKFLNPTSSLSSTHYADFQSLILCGPSSPPPWSHHQIGRSPPRVFSLIQPQCTGMPSGHTVFFLRGKQIPSDPHHWQSSIQATYVGIWGTDLFSLFFLSFFIQFAQMGADGLVFV